MNDSSTSSSLIGEVLESAPESVSRLAASTQPRLSDPVGRATPPAGKPPVGAPVNGAPPSREQLLSLPTLAERRSLITEAGASPATSERPTSVTSPFVALRSCVARSAAAASSGDSVEEEDEDV